MCWAVRPARQSNSSNCLVLTPQRQLGNVCTCFLPYPYTGPQFSLYSLSHFLLYFNAYLPKLFHTFIISFVLFPFSPLIAQIENISCDPGFHFRVMLSNSFAVSVILCHHILLHTAVRALTTYSPSVLISYTVILSTPADFPF